MEARRREHEREERREARLEPVEREREREYIREARVAVHPDLVHWGTVWVGLIGAFGVLIVLGLLALAVGLSTVSPAATTTAAPGVGTGILSILAVLISFFVGGWLAGRTSSARGRVSGIVLGTMIWSLGLVLLVLITTIGAGGVLGVFSGAFGGLAAPPTVTPGQAALMASGPAITALIGTVLTWIVTVIGAYVGTTSRAPEIESY